MGQCEAINVTYLGLYSGHILLTGLMLLGYPNEIYNTYALEDNQAKISTI